MTEPAFWFQIWWPIWGKRRVLWMSRHLTGGFCYQARPVGASCLWLAYPMTEMLVNFSAAPNTTLFCGEPSFLLPGMMSATFKASLVQIK